MSLIREEWKRYMFVFSILLINTSIILAITYGGNVLRSIFNSEHTFKEGTSIGSIAVDGMSKDQAFSKLADQVNEWKSATEILLHYENETVQVPIQYFRFDEKKSAFNAKSGNANQLDVTLREEALQGLVNAIKPKDILLDFDTTRLTDSLLDYSRELAIGLHQVDISQYVIPLETKEKNKLISQTSRTFTKEMNIQSWIEKMGVVEINSEEIISVMELLDIKDKELTPGERIDINFITSLMYETTLKSNFEIIERHISRELPETIEQGFEAILVPNEKDFIFKNPNFASYELKFAIDNNTLTISLYGVPLPHHYKLRTDVKRLKPRIVVQFNQNLHPSAEKRLNQGEDGYLIYVHRDQYTLDDLKVKSMEVSKDYYAPKPKIFERGIFTDEFREEIERKNEEIRKINEQIINSQRNKEDDKEENLNEVEEKQVRGEEEASE